MDNFKKIVIDATLEKMFDEGKKSKDKQLDIAALKFGIRMNFPHFTGEENTKEALLILESLVQENETLKLENEKLKEKIEILDQDLINNAMNLDVMTDLFERLKNENTILNQEIMCYLDEGKLESLRETIKKLTCIWKCTDANEGYYVGECGYSWTFLSHGPEHNKMNFCPGCGRKVKESDEE